MDDMGVMMLDVGFPFLARLAGSICENEAKRSVTFVPAAFFLRKPVRARMLNVLLDRFWVAPPAAAPTPAPAPTPLLLQPEKEKGPFMFSEGIQTAAQSLKVMRDVSAVLTHSLDAGEMLKQF